MHEQIIQVEKKDNKIFQTKKQKHIRRSYNTRAPSRQFNDPIYAGFDFNQENKQHQNWGPWVLSDEPVLKNSHSLHTNLRKIIPLSQQLQYKKINRKDINNRQQINQFSSSIFLNRKTTSRNQLPEIKQRYRPTLIEFKLASSQLLTKKLILKKQQIKHQIKPLQKDDYFTNKNIEPVKNKIKVSTVVYNYYDCLLNYNKKSEIIIEKILQQKGKQKQKAKAKEKDKDKYKEKQKQKQKQIKQQIFQSKYEGLKTYWKKRNTTHTALGL